MHPLAGQPATRDVLVNIPRLVSDYYINQPDTDNPLHKVAFGTSGHRGSSSLCTFNEAHILAISQAICDYRVQQGITGPIFLGIDTHALSEPAMTSAVEVFAANHMETVIQTGRGYTPTPVISHAVVSFNRKNTRHADGVVITPSHNPPSDGGFKYNPPHGGPAETTVTRWIEQRANTLIRESLTSVRRINFTKAITSGFVTEQDFMPSYIQDLDEVVDMKAIRDARLKIGVDPLGGAGLYYWEPIAEYYGLNIEVVSKKIDPTFSFMHLDKDGKIRMDCSSACAMAGLIQLKDTFDIAVGNDPDFDRHGIVTREYGLLNPNHYLAVAIDYLFHHRRDWPAQAKVGKTIVSSSMIDRVAVGLQKQVAEVPVGFKWFVEGLATNTMAFGGEESAGAAFLRKDGSTWCTDKDGFIMALLAAEITAVTGKDPGEHYKNLATRYGAPVYQRIEAPATDVQKNRLSQLTPEQLKADTLAGDPVMTTLTHAPWNNEAIGGLKVTTEKGWFAARPSGTEPAYKIYAESFDGEQHLEQIQSEAQAMVSEVVDKG
ncbi:phosphoglucomutase (alpha-D-glucose-1,6-bisphosphate-dependent) [Candidatus Sororendozoicomonas aggregata]|uniref:phosphoglucomutase (alpha-D-glucose-1,6-bisphosphate-dependent) n=1 Tax=Candidatus Sororendozoicomonas aggregata TaxID=3073239 RepID=UPI002ED1E2F8